MIIKESELIPDWLKNELDEFCPFCGSKYEVGYSPNGKRVTRHFCPNKKCPATISMKLVFVWDLLKVTGIKYGKSMELVKRKNIKYHLDAIPLVLENKPNIDIVTFMRLTCIYGIDSSWDSLCKDKESLEDILKLPICEKNLTIEDKEDILRSFNYFNVKFKEKKENKSIVVMTIMMTGDIMNLPNRELLVIALNKKYNGLLDLRYSKSIRRTGITALVKEEQSNTTGKVNIAKEYGIPIMTPEEFIIFVDKRINERLGVIK